MRELPILLSGPMVRAILEGRKTVARRVVKTQPRGRADIGHFGYGMPFIRRAGKNPLRCPYGQPGDRLWVRETWGQLGPFSCDDDPVFWRADYTEQELREQLLPRWRPSIHMPRWASRITLEVTDVRIERLRDISEEDAFAEGIQELSGRYTFNGGLHESTTPKESMRALWETTGGDWEANPWVWVVEFKRLEVARG